MDEHDATRLALLRREIERAQAAYTLSRQRMASMDLASWQNCLDLLHSALIAEVRRDTLIEAWKTMTGREYELR